MSEALIEARGIDVSFSGRQVLKDGEARVGVGEIVTLIGPNGAGKTTMARVMLGLLTANKGDVIRRADLRIGYMPQRLNIDPALPISVKRFLSLGLSRRDVGHGLRQGVLKETGVDHVADSPIQNISGGEMQRVLLARALLRNPDLLVLDEPVQGVDLSGQAELYALIRGIRDHRGCGVLMVSHDLHMVMAATDHVICLNQHVCCAGHPETVSRHPEFVALFGETVAAELSIYHHDHDHEHDVHGNVISSHDHPHEHEHDHG
ncbi:MAG: zinc ABC transporter ATP-binding protein ZnuC [Rhodospirillaceae bacterium]|jgi:zinc transport system ATP-binding protein|nr:zinc ABC transporter ATP-binding protein ZnuC [Rhodospirillaceae bacterium]MBT5244374.1 zinc ABC transporter ATP-binding protein ZnuC [Rhodospirillaceae bacterium]MBT5563735.1 zinc ABC transporter ATP-binding protein ZnuC [Rhodospirillaceae bacterium]MBT6241565.1 zinc ABC transporter ATP-binding protein ZnuC [Rhodospirillaceae bacterium]